jgi:hypothetical protein
VVGSHYRDVPRAMEMRQLHAHGDDQVVEGSGRDVTPPWPSRNLVVMVHRRHEINSEYVVPR